MKALRITLLTLLGIIILAVAAAAIFVATFDANRYKPEIERMVLDRTGRVLTIDGDIELTLFPKLGAQLGHITLSDKDPKAPFLTIESSAVSVALMPLISRQVLIDGISIHGLDLSVTRNRGGAFNFEDLLAPATDAAAAPAAATSDTATPALMIDISSIEISRATVRYRDLLNELDVDLSDLQLKTGQIAPQSSGRLEMSGQVISWSLGLNSKVSATSDYVLELDTQTVELNRLAIKIGGSWQDFKAIDASLNLNLSTDLGANSTRATDIKAAFKAQHMDQALDVQLSTSQLQSSSQAGSHALSVAPTEGKLSLTAPNRRVQSDIKLPAFEFAQERLALTGLSTNTTINDPALGKEALVVQTTGDLRLDLNKEVLSTTFSGQFDGSPIKASLGVAGFGGPALTFDVALDRLKLDRFTQGATQGSSSASNAQTPQSSATGNQNPAIDLSALKGHNVKGKLRVGQVLSKGVTIEQVQADITLNQGRLSVAPFSAQLFGGKMTGSLGVDSNKNQYALKQAVTGIRLESLLTALGQEPKVTGLGTLNLDLTTTGATTPAMTQNLAGSASVNLKDGAIKGIDIGAILANVRTVLGKAPTEQGSASGQTTFAEMAASATIEKGIATNRDLIVRAPAFRVEGNGTINIPASSLDYQVRVAVVETSSGQGGADLAALRGVTVPVRVTGTFDKLRYQVDVASLMAELAKSKLGDRARDEVNKVVPGLGDALKGLFGR
jgi:AsmA protein